MQGNRALSRVDLWYTELLPLPAVTSVSFYNCDSALGDSLEFHQPNQAHYMNDGEHGISLHAIQCNRASSCGEGEVSDFFSSCGVNLGYILELCPEW